MYKLISKVLAGRLGEVIESIISPNQSAFIKKRHIADGVVVINEVFDLAKKREKECLILKVDYMLGKFGFNEKWRSWMRAYVFSGNQSILVNGSMKNEVNIQWGLKQGYPQLLS